MKVIAYMHNLDLKYRESFNVKVMTDAVEVKESGGAEKNTRM